MTIYTNSQFVNTTSSGGTSTAPFLTVFQTRNPLSTDIQYPQGKRWINTTNIQEFVLLNFSTSGGSISANWRDVTSSGNVETLTGNSGGAVLPDSSNNINFIGDGVTINIVGNPAINTLTAAIVTPLALTYGGTNASLTASNGGIFYSTASAGAILSGTVTANQMLQSGSSSAPTWSTSTWPATTTINQILYSSSANTVTGITAGTNGVLISGTTGIPSWLANSGTPGFVLVANSAAPPSWQSVSAAGAITSIATDSGTATPTTGTINLKGQATPNITGIKITASGNSITGTMFSPFVSGSDFIFAVPNLQNKSTQTGTFVQVISQNLATSATSSSRMSIAVPNGAGDCYVLTDPHFATGGSQRFKFGQTQTDVFRINSTTDTTSSNFTGINLFSIDAAGITAQFSVSALANAATVVASFCQSSVQNQDTGANSSTRFTCSGQNGAGDTYLIFDPHANIAGNRFEIGQTQADVFKINLTTDTTIPNMSGINCVSISSIGVITLAQGQVCKVTVPGAYPYTILATDYFVSVDTSAPRTVALPASPVTGQTYRIKDVTGSGGTNNITVDGNGHNINGSSTLTINSNYGSIDTVYTGTIWAVV